MVTGCVSSRLIHQCEGEGECGLHGLPHVLCVPVPSYAQARAEVDTASGDRSFRTAGRDRDPLPADP